MNNSEKQMLGAGVPIDVRNFFRKQIHKGKFRIGTKAARLLKLQPVDASAEVIKMDQIMRVYAAKKAGVKKPRTHTGMMINGHHSEATQNPVPQTDGYATNATFDVDVRLNADKVKAALDAGKDIDPKDVVVQLTENGEVDKVFQGDANMSIQVPDESGEYFYDRYSQAISGSIASLIKGFYLAKPLATDEEITQGITTAITDTLGNAYNKSEASAAESASPASIQYMDDFQVTIPGEGELDKLDLRIAVKQGGLRLYGGAASHPLKFSFKGLFSKIKTGICKAGRAIKQAATKVYKIVSSKIQQMGGVGSIIGSLVTAGTGVPFLGTLASKATNTLVAMVDPALAGSTPTDQTPQNLSDLKNAAMAVIGESKEMIINDYIHPSKLARLRSMSTSELMEKHGRTHDDLNKLTPFQAYQMDNDTKDLFVEEAFAAATMNAPEYEGFPGSGDDTAVPSTQAQDYATNCLHWYFGINEENDKFSLFVILRGDTSQKYWIAYPKTKNEDGGANYAVATSFYLPAPNVSFFVIEWTLDEAVANLPAFMIGFKNITAYSDINQLLSDAIHVITTPLPIVNDDSHLKLYKKQNHIAKVMGVKQKSIDIAKAVLH